MKNEKCIIIGGSGSGKDFLYRSLVNQGLRGCLKITTRPMRVNESNNREYKFYNNINFNILLDNNEFIVWESFRVEPLDRDPEDWYYGITHNEFNKSQVFIMTPSELSKLGDKRKDCFVVYLDIDRSIRESRISERGDQNDSIKRRLDADDIDFNNFNDYDLKITDYQFDPMDIYNLMF